GAGVRRARSRARHHRAPRSRPHRAGRRDRRVRPATAHDRGRRSRRPRRRRTIAAELAARGFEPQHVVNNAGFGLAGIAASLDRTDQLAMVDVNIRALTELSLAFVDSLARHRGGILNVASIAGFLPGPGMAVYYASKAYV